MKKIIFLIAVTLVGCTYEKDGKVVKDSEGNLYFLKGTKRVNESYFLKKIDTTDYNSMFK